MLLLNVFVFSSMMILYTQSTDSYPGTVQTTFTSENRLTL